MPTTNRTPRRLFVPALAAAAVAVAATGIAVAQTRHDTAPSGTAPSGTEPAGRPTSAGTTVSSPLLVRDGDRVEVTGTVIGAPGKPVIYCPDLPRPAIGYPPGKEPPPSCAERFAVTLTGVDLAQLADQGTRQGVRFGRATLRGTWHDRTIAVDEQTPPVPVRRELPDFTTVPCPAPPGGWKSGTWGGSAADVERLAGYVRSHPDRFDDLRMAHPYGVPSMPTERSTITEVVIVPLLTGDLDRARRELGDLYGGNLCVYRATRLFALDDVAEANAAMDTLMRDRAIAIWGFSPGSPTKRGDVELLVLDEQTYAAVDRIGLKYFDLTVSVRPV